MTQATWICLKHTNVTNFGVRCEVCAREAARKGLKTYQYNDPNTPDPDDPTGTTHWIAADSETKANVYAKHRKWDKCGGCIFGETETAELLATHGGIDVIIEPSGLVVLQLDQI